MPMMNIMTRDGVTMPTAVTVLAQVTVVTPAMVAVVVVVVMLMVMVMVALSNKSAEVSHGETSPSNSQVNNGAVSTHCQRGVVLPATCACVSGPENGGS